MVVAAVDQLIPQRPERQFLQHKPREMSVPLTPKTEGHTITIYTLCSSCQLSSNGVQYKMRSSRASCKQRFSIAHPCTWSRIFRNAMRLCITLIATQPPVSVFTPSTTSPELPEASQEGTAYVLSAGEVTMSATLSGCELYGLNAARCSLPDRSERVGEGGR